MKIIDWDAKGNVVRFYLGKDDLTEWWGDDWNDRPFEHNAGEVYKEYVSGVKDIAFDFDDIVVEPNRGHTNSPYCKEDFVKRLAPCLVVVPKEFRDKSWDWTFERALALPESRKFYYGDIIQ